MSWVSSVRHYIALCLAVRRLEEKNLTVEEVRAKIRADLATREQRFLEMAERCVFGHRTSPYLPLLKAAGCDLGDLKDLVSQEGLEPALRRLRKEGVYFTFEEFKGRRPVERSGVSFQVQPEDFDNPGLARHYSTTTGGSTGTPTRMWGSIDDRSRWSANNLASLAAHGLVGMPSARWTIATPTAVSQGLRSALRQRHVATRFVSRGQRGPKDAFRYRMTRISLGFAARLGGGRLPQEIWVDPQDGLPLARWAEEALRTHDKCIIHATMSKAVRIALAARENGIDLTGTAIIGGGEPATPGKVNEVTKSGAKWIPYYIFSEGGAVGMGCANPVDGTDIHLYSDRLALIQFPVEVAGTSLAVDAFNFTTLSPFSPKVLLNGEMDDFGVVESRSCGCPLDDLGYDQHIRQIYSHSKLTGEGVTLVGSDMVRILEEVLPARFGGSSLDYQLVEEEDENSLTRLSLVIDPSIRIDDESRVVDIVLEELRAGDGASSMAGTIWAKAGTFQIRRVQPLTSSSRDKLLPLHVSRRPQTK